MTIQKTKTVMKRILTNLSKYKQKEFLFWKLKKNKLTHNFSSTLKSLDFETKVMIDDLNVYE